MNPVVVYYFVRLALKIFLLLSFQLDSISQHLDRGFYLNLELADSSYDTIYTSSAGPIVSQLRYRRSDEAWAQTISIDNDVLEFFYLNAHVEFRNVSGSNASVRFEISTNGVYLLNYRLNDFVVFALFGSVGLSQIFWCDYGSCDNCAEGSFNMENYCETRYLPFDCDKVNDLSKLHPAYVDAQAYPISVSCYYSGVLSRVIPIPFESNK